MHLILNPGVLGSVCVNLQLQERFSKLSYQLLSLCTRDLHNALLNVLHLQLLRGVPALEKWIM